MKNAREIANSSVLITSVQRENLLNHEQGFYTDMTLPLCEDSAQPSDFCYQVESGYEIDMAAYIHAERRNFNWELAKKSGYRNKSNDK